MKLLYLALIAAALPVSAAADAPRRPLNATPVSRHAQSADSPRSRATEIWRPATETVYNYRNGSWILDETIQKTYDDEGRVIREVSTSGKDTYVITYTYNENGKETERVEADLVNGVETPTQITSYTYDSRVTGFITSMLRKTSYEGSWIEDGYKRPVTRNADGNVTNIDIYVPYNGEYDHTEQTIISYNGTNADTYTKKALKYNGLTFYWQTGTEAKNIQWENTDGQIVGDFSTLVLGENRVLSAEMYYEGDPDGFRIVSYPDPEKPDFIALETGLDQNEIYERHSYTETDAYGSFLEIIELPYNNTEMKLIGTYDSHGNLISHEEYDTENGVTTLVQGEKYDYTYDEATGQPVEIIFNGLDEASDYTKYTPIYKSVFSSFVDTASTPAIGNDNPDAPVRYFNLQGIETRTPAPGAVYIRLQGKKADKVIF